MQVKISLGKLLYKALHPWKDGDIIELDDAEAAYLIGQGCVEPVESVELAEPVVAKELPVAKKKGEDKAE